ncbi:MAG: preprotein translocase subunit SecE [Sphingobacteriia bacterium]|nr:preprotein translocase subunit SecE [Sphingobacteriia bacterium]
MSNIKALEFIKQVKQEASKIVYPEKRDALITSAVVVFVVIMLSLFFIAIDAIIFKVIQIILNIGG